MLERLADLDPAGLWDMPTSADLVMPAQAAHVPDEPLLEDHLPIGRPAGEP